MANRALIVEDHAELRADLLHYLRSACPDCELLEAATVSEATEHIRTHDFLVVVSDVRFSEPDGEEGFEILKTAKKQNQSTQVILITSHPRLDHTARVRELGGLDYIGRNIPGLNFQDHIKWKFQQALAVARSLREESSDLTIELSSNRHPAVSLRGPVAFRDQSPLPLSLPSELLTEVAASIGWLINYDDEEEARRIRLSVCQALGRFLWEQTFGKDPTLSETYFRGLGASRGSPLTLRFMTDSTWLNLPFELLFHDHAYLALKFPLVRVLTGHNAEQRLWWPELQVKLAANRERLRMLLVASNTWSPTLGFGPIPSVDVEITRIKKALHALHPKVIVEALPSSKASRERVILELKQGYHVVVYAGHATFDPSMPGRSSLYFWEKTRGRGNPVPIEAANLPSFLKHNCTSLFYLSCCQGASIGGARQGVYSRSLGVMEAIAQCGVPTVIGHRWPLVDGPSSVQFTTSFFEHLLRHGGTPELALLKARQQTSDADPTWASSVMITHGR